MVRLNDMTTAQWPAASLWLLILMSLAVSPANANTSITTQTSTTTQTSNGSTSTQTSTTIQTSTNQQLNPGQPNPNNLRPDDILDPNEPPTQVDLSDYVFDPNAVEEVLNQGEIITFDPDARRFANRPPPFPAFLPGELGTPALIANIPLAQQKQLFAHNECQMILNNSQIGKDVFVPHKTQEEWDSFKDHTPPGVQLGACAPPPPPFPETVSIPVGPSGGPSPNASLPPLTPAAVAAACNTGVLKTRSTRVRFPSPSQQCQFGSNGNDPPTRWSFAARNEQSITLAPANTLICGMEFNFVNTNIWYDDNFFFLYNDNILASSYRANPLFANKRGLPQFDWNRIRGQHYGDEHSPPRRWRHRSDDYCNYGSTCTLPGQHRFNEGPFTLSVPRSTVQTAMINNGYTTQSLRVIVTGDNEPNSDCYHSGVEVDVTMTYVD